MKIFRSLIWITSFFINFVTVIGENPENLLGDSIIVILGRIIGVYVLSYLLLSPLYLIKKKELVGKLLPYIFLALSVVNLSMAIMNSPDLSESQETSQSSLVEPGDLVTLSAGWEERAPTGDNMIFLATKGDNVITIHHRENPEGITFSDLTEEERMTLSDLQKETIKNQFEEVEFLESAYKKVGNYDTFYLVFKRTISGNKTINMMYQFFEGKVYTLSAITPAEDFSDNRQDIERIFESFNSSSI